MSREAHTGTRFMARYAPLCHTRARVAPLKMEASDDAYKHVAYMICLYFYF